MPLTVMQQAFKEYFIKRDDPNIIWGHAWVGPQVKLIWS